MVLRVLGMGLNPIPKPAPRKRKKRTGFSSPPKPYCEACGRTEGRLGKRKECFTWHTHAQYVG